MKNLALLLFFVVALSSCEKESNLILENVKEGKNQIGTLDKAGGEPEQQPTQIIVTSRYYHQTLPAKSADDYAINYLYSSNQPAFYLKNASGNFKLADNVVVDGYIDNAGLIHARFIATYNFDIALGGNWSFIAYNGSMSVTLDNSSTPKILQTFTHSHPSGWSSNTENFYVTASTPFTW